MRSSPSSIQRRPTFHNHVRQSNVVAATTEPVSITITPQRRSNSSSNVDTNEIRRISAMCSIPPNIKTSALPPTSNILTAATTKIGTSMAGGTAAAISDPKAIPVMLDLAPGVKVHLRGADETQMAINNGFYIQCECLFCSATDASSSSRSSSNKPDEIYCILDCDYFLCPTCRSVYPNPISTNSNEPTTVLLNEHGSRYAGGLGLGFRLR